MSRPPRPPRRPEPDRLEGALRLAGGRPVVSTSSQTTTRAPARRAASRRTARSGSASSRRGWRPAPAASEAGLVDDARPAAQQRQRDHVGAGARAAAARPGAVTRQVGSWPRARTVPGRDGTGTSTTGPGAGAGHRGADRARRAALGERPAQRPAAGAPCARAPARADGPSYSAAAQGGTSPAGTGSGQAGRAAAGSGAGRRPGRGAGPGRAQPTQRPPSSRSAAASANVAPGADAARDRCAPPTDGSAQPAGVDLWTTLSRRR